MLFEMIHRSVDDRKPLRIRCQDCGHEVAWGRDEAIRRCGPEATPMDLNARLRCRTCGSRRVLYEL